MRFQNMIMDYLEKNYINDKSKLWKDSNIVIKKYKFKLFINIKYNYNIC